MAYLQVAAQRRINLQKTGCTAEIRRYRATREDRAAVTENVGKSAATNSVIAA